MLIEDGDDFIDIVAQAVIDRIEERERIASLVNLVVSRVLELQHEVESSDRPLSNNSSEEFINEKNN
jgi:hypothetical protein